MSVSVARVPTLSASRYLQQLAKHWSHKMEVVFTPEEGRSSFPTGQGSRCGRTAKRSTSF